MIKITITGLANFMTSNDAGKRKVLKDFKSPKPEGRAKAKYYEFARNRIFNYHKTYYPRAQWLLEQADLLDGEARASKDKRKEKLANNAKALRSYCNHFANNKYEVISKMNLEINHSGVRVSIQPDLHVREKGKEKLIKLGLTVPKKDDKVEQRKIAIICQAMLEATENQRFILPSSSILYFDVHKGKIHKDARIRSRITKEIEAACENIADIWNSI